MKSKLFLKNLKLRLSAYVKEALSDFGIPEKDSD